MFPVNLGSSELDDRGLFVVQDIALRQKILPLFSFDPRIADERPLGQGTTFRIDPWSRCATAFHVIEELFDAKNSELILRPGFRLAALELNGLVYGRAPIAPESWRPMVETFSFFRIEQFPFREQTIENATELIVARIRPSSMPRLGTPFLRIDLSRWRPSVGERVLALGYADLDRAADGASDRRPISQYLYGSFGEIIDVEAADLSRRRPWPVIRVAASWPGGMSGGPVFNEAGDVIGLVSTGFVGAGVSSATFFSGWNTPQQIFGSLDPINPGWFQCHAVFAEDGGLARCGQDEADIKVFATSRNLTDFDIISLNVLTGEYIRLGRIVSNS